MSLTRALKPIAEKLPPQIGRQLSLVPFALRLGLAYPKSVRDIRVSGQLSPDIYEERLLSQLRTLVAYAVQHVPFYREFYGDHGFNPADMRAWGDWFSVPIVTKADMQNVPLTSRIANNARGFKVNTGGTSGQPLEFLLDNQAFAREWAHMHHIWKSHGYRQAHLKLTFRGKHFDSEKTLKYNAVHNEFLVNANASMENVVESVIRLRSNLPISWVHGYPSLISEFAYVFASLASDRISEFRSTLLGVLLGSEYPAPNYRRAIEQHLSTNVVSWYGHSEMAILAKETSLGVYQSLPTYGYAESIASETGQSNRLVCTSLHNRAHPFIRYDTGDLIEPLSSRRGSLSFRVIEGRIGDFILDRKGMKHSLTAIIFGRHHPAFDCLKHIQVLQKSPGKVVFLVVPRTENLDVDTIKRGLDFQDLDLDWSVKIIPAPIRSQAGKIVLKVKSN